MYPSLNPVRNGSRWYAKKQTQQEKIDEISFYEERLAEKRSEEIQVTIPIWVNGEYIIPTKIMDKNEIEEEEEDNLDEFFTRDEEHYASNESLEEDEYNNNFNNNSSPSNQFANELYHDMYSPYADVPDQYETPDSPEEYEAHHSTEYPF
ncbi:uncharacterized protein BX663DRAFT_482709 [Cokeromyces recurvatus]|uniref:uncharacterized protein n=1 Tax=Cokeromyces recurvatus TaxID=90255 RepID=UPI002220F46F|nr:uncharacterized protein BX663DRAFT_482709 [Cokeromyces recurvatus]KAI7907031.1 hypothetical protein BX663DRAFT_482709 [Cokeromyces recurvatus]